MAAVSRQDGLLVKAEQGILLVGSWLLALLAIGSLAILVGGRMAEQLRRVGLLKAVGGTPALIARTPPAEYLPWPSWAAAVGLAVGARPRRCSTTPGAGLLGMLGAPSSNALRPS